MNIYKISQSVNTDYDTYDSAIVAAKDENAARKIHPSGDQDDFKPPTSFWTWTTPDKVTVKLVGVAKKGTPAGVILASFNAG